MGGTSAGSASVVYNFDSPFGDFKYTSPTFIQADTFVFPAPATPSFDSCSTHFGACNFVGLYVNGSAFGQSNHSLVTINTDAAGTIFTYFAPGALEKAGVYSDQLLGHDATLTVSVPEPASWSLMLIGFFSAGALAFGRRAQATLAAL
jgi:hypothetical protein